MTGILDRIRNTTVADLDKVTGDFSDAPKPKYRARVEREMVRIVKGADDLKPAVQVPNVNAGMVRTDGSGPVDTRPFKGMPTEPQRRYMQSLMLELKDLDMPTWESGMEYMIKMDAAEAWNPARGENASRWIDRLKAKVAELKNQVPLAGSSTTPRSDRMYPADTEHQGIPNGYYAVADAGPDDIHYFRVSRFRDGGIKLQEQASDTLHPVARGGRRTAVLNTILHVGPAEASALYGRTIGRCGRCNRTLTDAESRAAGIGPDCRKKM